MDLIEAFKALKRFKKFKDKVKKTSHPFFSRKIPRSKKGLHINAGLANSGVLYVETLM